MIASRNHSVFSRRPSVNPEFPSQPVPIHPALALVRLTLALVHLTLALVPPRP
jgi:hypothetical protein